MTINKQALREKIARKRDISDSQTVIDVDALEALLDELEAAERRNAELEDLLEAEVRLWTQRYDCANSRSEAAERRLTEVRGYNVDLAEESRQYQQRVAELEAREVKLPDVEKWRSPEAVRAQSAYRALARKELSAAGIITKVGE